MLYYIRKYPFSLGLLGLVVYLSFFKPPSIDFLAFQGFDKLVHFCMYGGVSGVLWLEFLLNHRGQPLPLRHALTGAVLCPVFFSGLIEIGQKYLTYYRGGEWLDFLANTGGVLSASLFAWYVLRPWIRKK
ncbi:MAG: VanZ family protein [Tannerellaceae bacterium]|nr:VanZ family protein [Tannerellaceae bacterium]